MMTLHYANTHNSDMLYAIRIEVADPFFYLEIDGKRYAFVDSREYGIFLEENMQADLEPVLLDPLLAEASQMTSEGVGEPKSLHSKLALFLIQKYGRGENKVRVSRVFPLDIADDLRAQGIQLQVERELFPQRAIKNDDEKQAIRESLVRTQKAFQRIEEILRESVIVGDEIHYQGIALTSEALKQETERVLLENNMLNIDGMIISCGEKGNHAAIPHHPGKGFLRPHQTIVCDIFPRHRASGYFADMTRTYVKGEPSTRVREMYTAVETAQRNAIAGVRAGVSGKEIHAGVEEYFLENGFDVGVKGFVHGTGHGLGLDVHEAPSVSVGGSTPLEEGNVVTIEPGLYYADIGGVRIEDVVYVTANGCENLTNYSTDKWIIA